MSKVAVVYWSGTGNTEMMAKAVAEGAGAELFSVSDFSGNIADYDRLAFGCPAMGAEVLEERHRLVGCDAISDVVLPEHLENLEKALARMLVLVAVASACQTHERFERRHGFLPCMRVWLDCTRAWTFAAPKVSK